MTKDDLKHGNVIELRNRERYLLTSYDEDDIFVDLTGEGYYYNSIKFNDNSKNSDLAIVKVYKDYTLKELLWERKEKPILTDDEKAILRSEKKQFKCEYIARNEDGKLFTFKTKPKKEEDRGIWVIDNNRYFYRLTSIEHLLFQFIKWEDNEPYKIEDLLKEVLGNDE